MRALRRHGPSRRAAVVGGVVFAAVLVIGLALMPGTNPSAGTSAGEAVPASLERIADRNQNAAAVAAEQQRARALASAEEADAAQARRDVARAEAER